MRRQRIWRLLALTLSFVLAVSAAFAYWSAGSNPGGNGAAAATTINQGATPTVNATGDNITVSWPARTLANGQPVSGYQVKRYINGTNTAQTMLSACTGTITALTCTENNVPAGTWQYTVTPVVGTNWRATENSIKSTSVTSAETTAPTNDITLSGVSGNAYKTANTIYYRGATAGSFTLTNAVSDSGSGPASSQSTALGGTTTGWTHTPSTVSTPTSGPYVSNPFSWTAATTTTPTESITGRDIAGNTATTNLSFVNDSSAPSAGSISYADGFQTSGSVSVTFAAGTDGGSGIATRWLQRSYAELTDGVCGTYSNFVNLGTVNPTSVYTDSAVSPGVCYKYRYVVTDQVGNRDIATSANVAKVSYDAAVNATSGLLSQWRLGEPTTSVLSADSFTAGGVGVALNTRVGETAASWSLGTGTSGTTAVTAAETNMRGQAIRRGDTAGTAIYHSSATPNSADYRVQADIIVRSTATGVTTGVVGRLSVATGASYVARYSTTSGSWELRSMTGGTTGATIGTYAQALAQDQIYHLALDMNGSTIKLMVDGVARVTVTNTDIGTAGRGGVRLDGTAAGTATTGLHLDNFEMLPQGYPRAVDSKGSNTGDYFNGATLGAAGAIAGSSNTAAQFDGVNDYVRVPTPTGLPVGSSARSVELWFKTSSALRQALYTYGSRANQAEFGLFINPNGANLTAWAYGLDSTISLASPVNDGAWHHVVQTYNGTTLSTYVDGQLRGSATVTRATVIDQYGFSLGGVLVPNDVNSGNFFGGSMDEVSFYTTALSQADVTSHYQLGKPTATPDFAGPTGGSVDATGLVGTGGRYSASTTLTVAFSAGSDPAGIASGARLLRAEGTLSGGACSGWQPFVQVGPDDPTSTRSETVADQTCYRYLYVVADTNGNETIYTSGDIKVDTTPYGAYWALNEGTGTTAEDSTGNGNTLTLQSGAGWTTGKVGSNALSVTGAANSFASTPSPVLDTSQSYTVTGWVNFATLTGDHSIAAIEGTNVGAFYLKRDVNGRFTFIQPSIDSTAAAFPRVDGLTPVAGTWYHVAGVSNKAAGTIELFVNGISQGTAVSSSSWKAEGSTVVGRGIWNGAPADFTNGSIDEVRFYPSVLSGSQISSLANDVSGPSGGSVTAAGLVGTGSRYSTSTTVNLSLAKGSDPSGLATSGNQLRRATAALTDGVCGTYGDYQLVATDPGTTVSETVADGACYAYRYVVSDTFGHSTTYMSGDIKVDTTAPAAPSLVHSAFTNTYWSGSGPVYYRSAAASGSFTTTATASDAGSGIASWSFPSLGTNWSSAPGGTLVSVYSWSGAPAAPGTKNVTVTNNAGLTSAGAPFTLTADDTAPTAGTINYADTTQSSTTISVAYTTGTDGGSGLGTRLLQRAQAPLTGTTCGTYTGFTTISGGTNPATSPVADGVMAGYCYKYQYQVRDKVGNLHTATSTSVVKVTAGTCGTQLLGNGGFEGGDTGAWTQSNGGIITTGSSVAARTGSWKAWLGGYGTDTTDTLEQQVTIPANCSATLEYYLQARTSEGSGPFDYFRVQVTPNGGTTTTVQTYSDRDAGTVWIQRTVDLSAYAGQTITLRFLSDEDGSNVSSFYVDDVSLTSGAAASYTDTVSGTTGLVNYFRLGEATTSKDTFTGTTGATVSSRSGEIGATWTAGGMNGTAAAVITAGGRVRKSGTSTFNAFYYSSGAPASANYTVEADVYVASNVTADGAGVIGRADTSNANGTFYIARYEQRNLKWVLYRVNNGTYTWLGETAAQALTAGTTHRLMLDMSGSTIRMHVNGVLRVSVTDASPILTTGRGGVALASTSATTITDTTGLHLDNFSVLPPAADSKGTNHGIYHAGPTLSAAGAINGDANTAVTFDGVDDYAAVNRPIADDFSIEFWFKSTQGLGTGTQWWNGAGLVDADVFGNANDFGTSLHSTGRVAAGVGGATNTSVVSATAGYNDGAWHHVVFTRTKASGALQLYVDGQSQGTATGSTVSLNAGALINYGRLADGTSYYAGSLDEVALYNVVLTQAQITAHYNAR